MLWPGLGTHRRRNAQGELLAQLATLGLNFNEFRLAASRIPNTASTPNRRVLHRGLPNQADPRPCAERYSGFGRDHGAALKPSKALADLFIGPDRTNR